MVHLAGVQSHSPRRNACSWLGFLETRDLRPAENYAPSLQARGTMQDECQVAVSRLSLVCQAGIDGLVSANRRQTRRYLGRPSRVFAESRGVGEPCCD